MGMSLKHLGIWAGVTAVAFMIGNGGGGYGPLIIWLAVSGVSYVISLYIHPLRACWYCKGSGRHNGMLFEYANRACTTCAGSGRKLRLGAQALRIREKPRS